MSETQPIYSPALESEQKHLVLTPEQEKAVRNITLGIEEVDESVREMAVNDVIKTLENGHPLNRVIEDRNQNSVGYIACEDFVPHEAYIKYFGTNNQTGLNLLKEIPAFLEYAKKAGYDKLNFHGWNNRLNHVLGHFGFKRLRTDTMGEFSVDFYEKALTESKTSEQISQERAKAFEQKYINKINKDYEQTLLKFTDKNRQQKEQIILSTFNNLSNRLARFNFEKFTFDELAKAVLRLKLARHFQTNDTVDENVFYDAIIETPKFLRSDKGSFFRLMEIHEEKTIQKIAEIRKKRAEIKGNETFNPYEALFETKSGKYYMARLLNMPHLEQESDYMNHCVGTSDSYINRIKNGDVEILSFRQLPQVDPVTKELKGEDRPIITIEYNLRTKTIEQLKKKNDEYLKPNDPYFNDVIEALKQLRQTKTDLGKPRDFKKIAESELNNIPVSDYCVLTERGEISFKDFNFEEGIFILKNGSMPITSETSKNDIAKIVQIIAGIKVDGQQIAQNQEEISKNTKMYIGPLSTDFLQKYSNLEHIYTSFPEGKIGQSEFKTTGKTGAQLQRDLESNKLNAGENAKFLLQSQEFVTVSAGETIRTVSLKVRDLFGDESSHTYSEILAKATEFGLGFLPHETGIDMLLNEKTQPKINEWFRVVTQPISGRDGYPDIFNLYHNDNGLWLSSNDANPACEWRSFRGLMFCLRNVSQET
jgi:hypothetical protein